MKDSLSAMQVKIKVSQFSHFFGVVAVLSAVTSSAYLHTAVTDRIICDYKLKRTTAVTVSHSACSDINWWFGCILKCVL
jgi:hypothetical protein